MTNRNSLLTFRLYSPKVLVRSTKYILRPKPTPVKDATLFFPTLVKMTILKWTKSHCFTALSLHLV